MPTVIVARAVAPGREREFERWLKRLLAAAEEAPGFVGADVQEPNELHPDEWLIVYQFADRPALDGWLQSGERTALMTAGADLVEGEAREQVIALTPWDDPVTVVSSARIRPGGEEAYRELHRQITDRIRQFDGFLRTQMFEPVEGVQGDTVVVYAFDSREHLDRWFESPERRTILEQMDPLLEGDRTMNVLGGFAGWFGASGARGPKRWKQAAVVLLALFPVVLVLTVVRQALAPDVPLVLAVLFSNVISVAILSWVVMPFLTDRLDSWLRR